MTGNKWVNMKLADMARALKEDNSLALDTDFIKEFKKKSTEDTSKTISSGKKGDDVDQYGIFNAGYGGTNEAPKVLVKGGKQKIILKYDPEKDSVFAYTALKNNGRDTGKLIDEYVEGEPIGAPWKNENNISPLEFLRQHAKAYAGTEQRLSANNRLKYNMDKGLHEDSQYENMFSYPDVEAAAKALGTTAVDLNELLSSRGGGTDINGAIYRNAKDIPAELLNDDNWKAYSDSMLTRVKDHDKSKFTSDLGNSLGVTKNRLQNILTQNGGILGTDNIIYMNKADCPDDKLPKGIKKETKVLPSRDRGPVDKGVITRRLKSSLKNEVLHEAPVYNPDTGTYESQQYSVPLSSAGKDILLKLAPDIAKVLNNSKENDKPKVGSVLKGAKGDGQSWAPVGNIARVITQNDVGREL